MVSMDGERSENRRTVRDARVSLDLVLDTVLFERFFARRRELIREHGIVLDESQ